MLTVEPLVPSALWAALALVSGLLLVMYALRRPTGIPRWRWTLLVGGMSAAVACVLIVLLHFRTSFIIAVTLPLAALASFGMMWALRKLGLADIQTNIMSLAGIAISIGVLVDASIVMAENVMHHLKNHFGEQKVQGDIRHLVLPACLTVGRPIFFSVVIMLLSFLPVFALGGWFAMLTLPKGLAFLLGFELF